MSYSPNPPWICPLVGHRFVIFSHKDLNLKGTYFFLYLSKKLHGWLLLPTFPSPMYSFASYNPDPTWIHPWIGNLFGLIYLIFLSRFSFWMAIVQNLWWSRVRRMAWQYTHNHYNWVFIYSTAISWRHKDHTKWLLGSKCLLPNLHFKPVSWFVKGL